MAARDKAAPPHAHTLCWKRRRLCAKEISCVLCAILSEGVVPVRSLCTLGKAQRKKGECTTSLSSPPLSGAFCFFAHAH